LVRGAEILVLSSHMEGIMLEWATRVIWLDQGRVREDGPALQVMEQYLGRRLSKPESET
jgi:lipopolysaccharide transport system ATP-binding protein